MAKKSSALANLDASLSIVRGLLRLEQKYADPPSTQDALTVEGLRAGCAVLVVAAFEEFLKSCFRDELSKLQSKALTFAKLPEKFQVEAVFKQLHLALEGTGKKSERLPEIYRASARVARFEINPEAMSKTQSNPSPTTVSQLFKDVACEKIFDVVRPRFERVWGAPVASTYPRDKLEEIVSRRHEVAHSGRALNVSRLSLDESVKFIRALSSSLELELRAHLRTLASSAK